MRPRVPLYGSLLIALLVLGGAVQPAVSQPASEARSAADFFHEAAQAYIGDDLPAAQRLVEQGLQVAPDDPKLRALKEKLEQRRSSASDSTGQGQSGQSDTPSPDGEEGQAPSNDGASSEPEEGGGGQQRQGRTPSSGGGSESGADPPPGDRPPDQPSRRGDDTDTPPETPPEMPPEADAQEGRPGDGRAGGGARSPLSARRPHAFWTRSPTKSSTCSRTCSAVADRRGPF